MKNWKTSVVIGALLAAGSILVGGWLAKPVMAQVRAAFVRDVDTPSLAPFRAGVDYTLCCLNDQRLLTTVPAGKRLVIEHISYWAFTTTGTQIVFASLRNGQYGPNAVLVELHPPHPAASSGFIIQDGSQMMKAYFEAGEEVWVSASKNTGDIGHIELRVDGHLITP